MQIPIAQVTCGAQRIVSRYHLSVDRVGNPLLVELLDAPPGFGAEEYVEVVLEDGISYRCWMVPESRLCAVVPERHAPER